ncbi:MAG: hypothetical protein RIS76_51 [Verrucomicrobiota bacterium]|jgi:transposase InsO family protein
MTAPDGVLDIQSRKIVGRAMKQTIESGLVLAALTVATPHRSPPPGLLFHKNQRV